MVPPIISQFQLKQRIFADKSGKDTSSAVCPANTPEANQKVLSNAYGDV